MLNFINNKFVKIILLKTIVLNNLVYDIFCGCLIGEKNNKEGIDNAEIKYNKDKKDKKDCCGGISGKGNSYQSDIDTDGSTDGESDISDNDGEDIKRKDINENLIKNKNGNLLKILEEIKNNNKYLSDKIEEQIIKILETKIKNSNNSNISNIDDELNDLKTKVNSKLDKIKNNHIDAVTNIINSIEILENCYKEKYKLPKYTLNIDEVNKTSFSGINNLNGSLERIKKGYKDSINGIVKNLKIEFEKLKKQETDNNKLDVNDEDFNNLTDVSKIIDINKKLFTYDIKLKKNKTEIINKINQINEKLEKHIKLLNIESVKETNLYNENIDDLIKLYEKLSDIYKNLLIKFSKYKEKQQKKYIELTNVYNEFKDKLNFIFF